MAYSTLLSAVTNTLKRYEMLPENAAVLVGFSGGADSVTLLSVLDTLSSGAGDVPPFSLYAVHVNHSIRGEEADRDEVFCEQFCEARNIPLYVRKVDVPSLARRTGESEETCGRRVRYEVFEELVDLLCEDGFAWDEVRIATAHTASDNAETMLFHLARGTGLSGLTGIPPVRKNIIRPLITCTREEVEAYCGEAGLTFVKDSTNTDRTLSRNRIRYESLTALKAVNEAAVSNMARTAETLRRDADYFDRQTKRLLQTALCEPDAYDTTVLNAAEDAVLVRALGDCITAFAGIQAEQRHVETVLAWLREGAKFKQLQVPGGAYVTLAGERMLLHWPKEPPVEAPRAFRQVEAEDGEVRFFSGEPSPLMVRLRKVEKNDADFRALLLEKPLDYDKIDFNFEVRTRAPGDVFAPQGRGIRKKLKTLYQEEGVPVEERNDRVILEQEGQIAWLEGFGAAEGFAASEDSTTLWSVEVIR
ncbi:MAG: tRNA lysidine(34) synthetase TilS [Clostridia bacterium]|nr:tRNA lysidine(34) synthetase TilS [Clostridia bacterium]